MIKAKHLNASVVTLGSLERITGRHFTRRVFYDGAQSLIVQLPSMLVSRDMYELKGKFYINILVEKDTFLHHIFNTLNTSLDGCLPIARITRDKTGTFHHYRLRVTLPPLIEGTVGLRAAKVGQSISAIAHVDRVDSNGHWDLALDRIRPVPGQHEARLV